MNRSKRGFAGRLLAFAVLVWIGSACSGDIRVPAPLLSEGFNGAFPGFNWTTPTLTGSGQAPTIVGSGNPAPGLRFTVSAPTGTSSTATTDSFNNPNLTISVQEAVTSVPAGSNGSSSISILDSTPAVVGTATWDNATGTVAFTIAGVPALATSPLTSDGTMHTFKFNVDAAGDASWILDGATKQTVTLFPAGLLTLQLSTSFGTGSSWPSFLFDNITVTSP